MLLEADRLMGLAAETGDLALQTHVSLNAVLPYRHSGQYEKSLKALAFCLANRSLVETNRHLLLMSCACVLNGTSDLPQISFESIKSMEQEFRQIVKETDDNISEVLCEGWCLRSKMGRLEEAWEMYQDWKTNYRDRRSSISICKDCSDHSLMKLYINRGENEVAIKLADKVIASNANCVMVPKGTHAEVLLPLMRLGNIENAKHHHEEGMKLLKRMCIYTLSMHLIFLLHIGQRDRMRKLLEDNLLAAVKTQSIQGRLFMYRAVWFLCELEALEGRSDSKLKLPSSIECFRSSQKYSNAELEDWFRTASLKMIKQHDERNGNKFYMQCNDECRQLVGLEPLS